MDSIKDKPKPGQKCRYCAGKGKYNSEEKCYWCEGSGIEKVISNDLKQHIKRLRVEYDILTTSIHEIFDKNAEALSLTHPRLRDMIKARKLVLETIILLKENQ